MEFGSTFWVAIAFVIFIIAVFKPLKKVATGALDEKIAQIRNEIEEAQRLREEAQSTLASYQLKHRRGHAEGCVFYLTIRSSYGSFIKGSWAIYLNANDSAAM